jgi:hypothetical protein
MIRLLSLLAATALCVPAADTWVRVSKRDPRYLELSDGTPYIPVGLNMIAPPGGADSAESWRVYEEWLSNLAANGGNYIRVWLSNPFWAVEHEKSGVYDEERAARIERMLDLCRRHGIRVKMTMEHFRSVGGGRQAWADQPLHNVTNGGTAKDIAGFFNGEASQALFRKKIAWYAKRFGSRPEIYGWELWNEVDAVNGAMQPGGPDVMSWTEMMLKELRAAFPRNLVMQSLGSFDNERKKDIYRRHSVMAGNDLAQVHRYLDLGAAWTVCGGPVDVLASQSIAELLSWKPGKPVLLAESGAVEPNHSGPFKLYTEDSEGVILHDVLFAPFFSGAAGSGQIWHWDSYVARNGLWRHFARFAEAVQEVDPPAEMFRPQFSENERVRIYSLAGRSKTLVWIRDKRATWMSELRDKVRPEPVEGLMLPAQGRRARVYDPWENLWYELSVEGGRVAVPRFTRSVVVHVLR